MIVEGLLFSGVIPTRFKHFIGNYRSVVIGTKRMVCRNGRDNNVYQKHRHKQKIEVIYTFIFAFYILSICLIALSRGPCFVVLRALYMSMVPKQQNK